MNWFCPVFTDLNIFFVVPFTVEPVFLEQKKVRVCLIITTAVRVFEKIQIQFVFFCFRVWWIHFFVGFATSPKLTMVFKFVRSITLNTLRSLNSTRYGGVSPFPTIFTLWNTKVHVGSSDCDDILFHIKVLINKAFGLTSTLNIPDINPNNRHIWLQKNFDNSWFWSENNIIKNLILLNDLLYIARREAFLRFVMGEIGNAYYFQIRLRLWESRNFYIKEVNVINILCIFQWCISLIALQPCW